MCLVGGGLVGICVAVCLPLLQCLSLAPVIPIARASESKYAVHSLYGCVDGTQHSTWEALKVSFSYMNREGTLTHAHMCNPSVDTAGKAHLLRNQYYSLPLIAPRHVL